MASTAAWAGWRDELGRAAEAFGLGDAPASGAGLADAEIVQGLKEALATGTERAILQLGQTDGFWKSDLARVALPPAIDRAESSLRRFGAGAYLDQLHLTMNRAAERAVPQVADIFGDAIRQLTLTDARAILSGPDDAATQYFRRVTGDALAARVRPLVAQATNEVGLTRQYKSVTEQAGPFASALNLDGADLDSYVTSQALGGLFDTLAVEEQRIRDNPSARTSDILKKVFGR